MVEEEELKLKSLAEEKALDELRRTYLTYEEYYNYDVRKETEVARVNVSEISGSSKGGMSF